MKYQDKRTVLGRFFYSLSYRWGIWIDKHVWLYYLLLCTWGVLETIAGLSVALAMIISGHRPNKSHRGFYFLAGDNWGGFSLSFIDVIGKNMGDEWTVHTIHHECGHSYQVALFGPFWLFLVAVPSQVRWCIAASGREITYEKAWFEESATDVGNEVFKKDEQKSL